METDLFKSCGLCWVFQICWHIECSTFEASSFRIWNSSTGILSPQLALFAVILLDFAHLISLSMMSGSRWVITPSWLFGSLRSFLYTSFMYFCYFLISSASVRSLPFLLFIMHIPTWKCYLEIANFLEKISSLSNFIVFLYFFALFIWRRPSYLSLLFSGKAACIWVYLSFSPPQTTTWLVQK